LDSAKVREEKKSSREFWGIQQTVLILVDIYTKLVHSRRLVALCDSEILYTYYM
jgi:hypothetical protein